MKPYKKEKDRAIDLSRSEIMILSTLIAKERYGLEIVEQIKKATDGKRVPSLGGLYTTLHRMEEKGLVIARWGESSDIRQGARRRYYSISAVGERAFKQSKDILLKTFRLADIIANSFVMVEEHV